MRTVHTFTFVTSQTTTLNTVSLTNSEICLYLLEIKLYLVNFTI
jgi:hypothetical protein